jgi:hypothetical protein
MRALLVAVLLTGCGAHVAPRPAAVTADLPACPAAPATPAPLPRVRTTAMLLRYEINLELAREAERRRGDDCAARAAALESRP